MISKLPVFIILLQEIQSSFFPIDRQGEHMFMWRHLLWIPGISMRLLASIPSISYNLLSQSSKTERISIIMVDILFLQDNFIVLIHFPNEAVFSPYMNISFGQFPTLRNVNWCKVLNYIKYIKLFISVSRKFIAPFSYSLVF